MPDMLWPVDDVFIAMVETDAIVLTVSTDRYACLVDAAGLFRVTETGGLIPTDADAADALVASGLLQRTKSSLHRKQPCPPRRDGPTDRIAPFPAIIRSMVQLSLGTLVFRRLSFAELVAAEPTDPKPWPKTDPDTLSRLLAGYRVALPWIPSEGECLQRAFLLRRLLQWHGLEADWIFGVRTWPFSAHCWLQIGDRVVGDTVGRVRSYTPIMVV